MPCEPLHHMFATTMFVLFGLNAIDTISALGPYFFRAIRAEDVRTDTVIVVVHDGVTDGDVRGTVNVPSI